MLVIKVPASVTDESMKRIGELRIELSTENPCATDAVNFTTYHVSGATNSGRSVGVQFTNQQGSTLTGYTQDPLQQYAWVEKNKNGYFFLGRKDNLTRFQAGQNNGFYADIAEFNYCKNLYELRIQGKCARGSIESIPNIVNQLTIFDVRENKVSGNVEVFKDNTILENVTLQRTHCTGNLVTAFGNNIALTRFFGRYSTEMTGNAEDVFDAMVSNGRTSGNLEWTDAAGTLYKVTFSSSDARGWHYTA